MPSACILYNGSLEHHVLQQSSSQGPALQVDYMQWSTHLLIIVIYMYLQVDYVRVYSNAPQGSVAMTNTTRSSG